MPQLSTTHIFLIYFWTWFVLWLLTQKTNMVLINKTPTKLPHQKTKNSTTQMPWT